MQIAYLLIPLVAGFASLLTFFSGFGLGTLLTPVLYLFFPPLEALALSGIVHLLNNVFKFALVYPSVNYSLLLKFGITAMLGAWLGAWLINQMSETTVLYEYQAFQRTFSVSLIKFCVACLLLIFVFIELLPSIKKYTFPTAYLPFGGFISGFFGGLSGNQGALRTMFLAKVGLTKEAFIATGIAIACVIDITRLSVYYQRFQQSDLTQHWQLLLFTVLAAFLGAYLGSKWLKKATLDAVQKIVTVALLLIALGLMAGWV
ncbi:MAG: sulfite exporter TauE/SafE family protein [Bacteroidia bacterium]